MNRVRPLSRLQLLAIVTVVVSDALALLGIYDGSWWVGTTLILMVILGASILEKIGRY